jgi:hypothetical protein
MSKMHVTFVTPFAVVQRPEIGQVLLGRLVVVQDGDALGDTLHGVDDFQLVAEVQQVHVTIGAIRRSLSVHARHELGVRVLQPHGPRSGEAVKTWTVVYY